MSLIIACPICQSVIDSLLIGDCVEADGYDKPQIQMVCPVCSMVIGFYPVNHNLAEVLSRFPEDTPVGLG